MFHVPFLKRVVLVSSSQTAMADSTPASLKVILGENNLEKRSLPNGIPESLDDLLSKVKTFFGLKGDVRLQSMDQDFGNDFFNLNSTTQLQDLGTIKVNKEIHLWTLPLTPRHRLHLSVMAMFRWHQIILSSPESVSSRAKQRPADFPIPQCSYDAELQLGKGNSEFNGSHKMLTVSSRSKCDILKRPAETIHGYKAYPDDSHVCTVAEALIKKHPCLKEPGHSMAGNRAWSIRWETSGSNCRRAQSCSRCFPWASWGWLVSILPHWRHSGKPGKRKTRTPDRHQDKEH